MYDVTDLLHVQVLNKIFLSYAYKHKGFWTLLHIKRLHGTTATRFSDSTPKAGSDKLQKKIGKKFI